MIYEQPLKIHWLKTCAENPQKLGYFCYPVEIQESGESNIIIVMIIISLPSPQKKSNPPFP